MDRAEFDIACAVPSRDSEQALRAFGHFDRTAFAYNAYHLGLLRDWCNDPPLNEHWPRHKALTRPLREAIFISPIVADLQQAMVEQIDHETGEKLRTAIISEVERIEMEETL